MAISVYYGDEDYLLQQEAARLRNTVVSPALGPLGHRILNSPTIGAVLEAVGAVCLSLGGKTLVEIREFEFLNKAASGPDEKQLVELMDLLASHDENKHILFLSAKINRTIKFAKWLTGHKTLTPEIRECKTPAFYQTEEATQRLILESRRRSVHIEPKAAMLLVEQLGVSLRPLMTEVEKLSVYAGDRPITPQDVARLSNHNENTFRMLADWVHCRNRGESFRILEEILLRQHPTPLFALIQGWLGGVFQWRYWRQQGYTQARMAELSGKHPYRIKKDLDAFSSVSWERLETLRARTLDLEWKMKTGALPGRLALEMLLAS